MKGVLFITDSAHPYGHIQKFLSDNQCPVFFCRKSENILSYVEEKKILFVIIDMTEEEIEDLSLLKLIKNFDPLLDIIIIGDSVSSEKIGETIRLGASEYIAKPVKVQTIQSVLAKIREKSTLRHETYLLEKELNGKYLFQGMIGKNPQMLDIFTLIERISRFTTNVLITGKTGTGKEMVARAIHELSPRRQKKLVICDCSVLPESLFEAELFGYTKGAFTGADRTKKGLIEEANEGTLFLDEIGNLPLFLQPKLLRILEERRFRRLGSNESISLDIRIISATGQDLKAGIRNRTFREDLYHRLNILEINLPSLKERKEDIPLLIRHFVKKYATRFKKKIAGMSRRVQKILINHDWPGNVRELENIIEHASAICLKSFIDIDDLPKYLQKSQGRKGSIHPDFKEYITLEELEKRYIVRIIEATQGNIQQSAQILGISRYTLYRKMKKFGF